jgi:hypothetical protein
MSGETVALCWTKKTIERNKINDLPILKRTDLAPDGYQIPAGAASTEAHETVICLDALGAGKPSKTLFLQLGNG